jgi:UDP:flavonoid glycosyltransferase YjiC (YdhE family)
MSFESIPIVNLNAIELDFPHEPHPVQHHTGPLIQLDRVDDADPFPTGESEAVRRFLTDRDPARTLVCCGFGTAFAGDDSAFIRRLIDAVRGRVDWDVVITLGGRRLGVNPSELPDHVRLFDWVPQLEVLKHADCAVIHAGPGSIYECVHFGVPMVLYPFRVNDQLGYAARAAYHGLGIIGDRDADDAATIRARIEQILGSPNYADAVRAMNRALQLYEIDNTAVAVVEALAGVRPRPRPNS